MKKERLQKNIIIIGSLNKSVRGFLFQLSGGGGGEISHRLTVNLL